MRAKNKNSTPPGVETVAGNGLLHRRALLGRGIVFAGALTTGAAGASRPPPPSRSRTIHGAGARRRHPGPAAALAFRGQGRAHAQQSGRTRRAPSTRARRCICSTAPSRRTRCISPSCTPAFRTSIPTEHRLVIHGLVRQPLEFTLDKLMRYPMVSRMHFVECGGNSAPLFSKEPLQATVQALHGLSSCAEWTGVPLSILLDEAGVDPKAKWFVAEGADAAAIDRSVPLKKGMDDAMIALYQNGERIMPGNGYPMRLLLPGWEGNMNTKFVRRIQLTDQPAMSYYEERNYSPLLPDGKAYRFYFINEVKSFITQPSFGYALKEPGYLSYLRHRLFGHRPHRQGPGLGRRRQELGRSRPAGAGAIPRPIRASACPGAGTASPSILTQPRLGRGRQCAAAAGGFHRPARADQDGAERARLPQQPLQQPHQLGHRRQGGDQACLRVRPAARRWPPPCC